MTIHGHTQKLWSYTNTKIGPYGPELICDFGTYLAKNTHKRHVKFK